MDTKWLERKLSAHSFGRIARLQPTWLCIIFTICPKIESIKQNHVSLPSFERGELKSCIQGCFLFGWKERKVSWRDCIQEFSFGRNYNRVPYDSVGDSRLVRAIPSQLMSRRASGELPHWRWNERHLRHLLSNFLGSFTTRKAIDP